MTIQVPVAPDGTGGNGEVGERPALSRNCNLVVNTRESGRPPGLCVMTLRGKGCGAVTRPKAGKNKKFRLDSQATLNTPPLKGGFLLGCSLSSCQGYVDIFYTRRKERPVILTTISYASGCLSGRSPPAG